jgi:hypothetical protein
MAVNNDEYHKMIESLSSSTYSSPYVCFDLEDEIKLDGDFTVEDLEKIIAFKKKFYNVKD